MVTRQIEVNSLNGDLIINFITNIPLVLISLLNLEFNLSNLREGQGGVDDCQAIVNRNMTYLTIDVLPIFFEGKRSGQRCTISNSWPRSLRPGGLVLPSEVGRNY